MSQDLNLLFPQPARNFTAGRVPRWCPARTPRVESVAGLTSVGSKAQPNLEHLGALRIHNRFIPSVSAGGLRVALIGLCFGYAWAITAIHEMLTGTGCRPVADFHRSQIMRLALLTLLALTLRGQTPAPAADPWKQLDFLVGNWAGAAGEKDTALGAGQGEFSFDPELNRHIPRAPQRRELRFRRDPRRSDDHLRGFAVHPAARHLLRYRRNRRAHPTGSPTGWKARR
jgi:hypothetical protein